MWQIWPPSATSNFLRIALARDLLDGDELRVSLIFTCTVVETLFQDILEGLLWSETNSGNVIELVLDSYGAIPKREGLFRKLRHDKLSRIMAESPHRDFYANWKKLMEYRNGLIHGDYWGRLNDRWPIEEVASQCLPVFAYVNNNARDHIEKSRQ